MTVNIKQATCARV